MAVSHGDGKNVPTDEVRHTKEDALSDREFQLLLEGASDLDEYYAFQARFCILVFGRLGMRRGELAHITEEWINWRRNMIEVPRYDPCDKGKDGGPCGYCRKQARQEEAHNEEVTFGASIARRWHPKTDAAARSIPYDFDPRAALVVERFFDRYDRWPLSCQAINRRIKKAAAAAPSLNAEMVYPHALRATAATYHANRGLDALPLQAMLGWAQLSTAQNYVRQSGENTARALQMVHSR